MNNTIKINEGFAQMLGKDLNKFIFNLKGNERFNNVIIRILNNKNNYEDFIIGAFIWKDTIEGDKYWRKISKRKHIK